MRPSLHPHLTCVVKGSPGSLHFHFPLAVKRLPSLPTAGVWDVRGLMESEDFSSLHSKAPLRSISGDWGGRDPDFYTYPCNKVPPQMIWFLLLIFQNLLIFVLPKMYRIFQLCLVGAIGKSSSIHFPSSTQITPNCKLQRRLRKFCCFKLFL